MSPLPNTSSACECGILHKCPQSAFLYIPFLWIFRSGFSSFSSKRGLANPFGALVHVLHSRPWCFQGPVPPCSVLPRPATRVPNTSLQIPPSSLGIQNARLVFSTSFYDPSPPFDPIDGQFMSFLDLHLPGREATPASAREVTGERRGREHRCSHSLYRDPPAVPEYSLELDSHQRVSLSHCLQNSARASPHVPLRPLSDPIPLDVPDLQPNRTYP